jgi:hypothetical protein
MIDDPGTVARLMDQLQAHLPMPAFPTKEIVRTLRHQGVQVSVDGALAVKSVLYLGDEGGIGCALMPTPEAKTVCVVSLTHLRMPPHHPLFDAIRAYQRQRVRRLAAASVSDDCV